MNKELNNYCPRCFDELKLKIRKSEYYGFVGSLKCKNFKCSFFFEYPEIIPAVNLYSATRIKAKNITLNAFNKKYNPYKVKKD